jgi:dTMP kinase
MLFAFEGLDGAGKTTQIQMLAAALDYQHGIPVHVVRNPYDSQFKPLPWGDPQISLAVRMTQRMLILRDLYDRLIKPALHDGMTVLLDRSWGSMAAYDGVHHGQYDNVPRGRYLALHTQKGDLFAAPTIYLDVPVEIGAARAGDEDAALYRRHDGRYMQRVHAAYATLARRDHWHVIDATQPALTVHHQIAAYVLNKMGKK